MKKKKDTGARADKMLDQLRDQAEKVIGEKIAQADHLMSESEFNKIFQELQVHQLELEMQNDELLRANEELEIQRIKFAGIYDLAPVGYFILEKTGLIEEVNTEGLALLNLQRSALVHRRFQSFILPDDLERFFSFHNKMLATLTPQSCQVKLSSGGAPLIAQLNGIAINTMSPQDVKCYIAAIDITERIESELKLAKTKERLELALEASSAGTWEIDMKTGFMFLDDSNHKLFRLKAERFNGKYESFLKLVHPDDRQRVDWHFRESLSKEKEIDIDFKIENRGANNIGFISLRGHAVSGVDGNKCFVGTMMDITEKTLLEKEASKLRFSQQRNITSTILLTQENERRRISEALHDSVSQLLYGIKLNLQQVTNHAISDAHLQKIKKLIDEAIKEARNISFELAPSILTDFGLPTTLSEMAKKLSTPSLSINVSIELENRLPLALEVNIFRMLQELINNCIKHSGADMVNLAIKKKNNSILVRVKDNGKGFNPEEVAGHSRGSGLSSIKNRLSLHNGRLQIDSKIGRGTTVYITIDDVNEIV